MPKEGPNTQVGCNPQARRWVFTFNNPQEHEYYGDEPLFPDSSWHCYQLEIGKDGVPHFQGAVIFPRQVRRTTIINKNPPAQHMWIAPMDRRNTNPRKYVTKDDETYIDGPWEYGIPPKSHQGSRTDIKRGLELCKEGTTEDEFKVKFPDLWVRYNNVFRKEIHRVKPKSRCQEVILHYGDTGLGKSKTVQEFDPNHYEVPVTSNNIWFDNYEGQDTLLIDEFEGQYPLAQFLRMIDRHYVRQLPVKGAHVWVNPKTIFVTSNSPPSKWYKWQGRENKYPALLRRFTKIRRFNSDGTITDLTANDLPLNEPEPSFNINDDPTMG